MNPIALRKAKIVYNFGLSECNRVKRKTVVLSEDIKIIFFYVPNFGEVERAYWFGPVRPSVRPSVCPSVGLSVCP